MKTTTTILQMLVRLCFAVLVILGITFWTGHGMNLIPVHMGAGVLLVLCLWVTALIGFAARIPAGQSIAAIVGGFVVVAYGMRQTEWLPGAMHWIVQVGHLLVGMIAVGMNESMARAIKTSETAPVDHRSTAT